ncbi:MAG: hypothetical protein IH597_14790 [Bacteroidales bacterium]|nr:hypothetical protein [Bacteroidales bacterium]
MLSLRLGSTLVNTKSADIPVVLRNPLFVTDEGKIPGSFIFNFSVPLTEELKRELSFAHRPARKGKPTWQHPFLLRFGILKFAGTANITELNNNEVEVSMPVDVGSLSAAFGNTRLRDLDIDETVPWDPKITFASYSQLFEYSDNNVNPRDFVIIPDVLTIDSFSAFDVTSGEWTCPADGIYYLNVVLNWAFKKRTVGDDQVDAGKNPKFIVEKNGMATLYFTDITSNNFVFNGPLGLLEGDVIRFIFNVEPVFFWPVYWLQFHFDPGCNIFIDDGTTPFAEIPQQTWPDVNFSVYPYHNPEAMGNLPDSLFKIDINDTKDQLSRFAPVVNYYRDGVFPWVVHGPVNGIYYSLLNLFSPSPYLAFIIKEIFNHTGYHIINNVFNQADLKTIACITPDIINNYFPAGNAPLLKTFLPDAEIRDFLRNICSTLGIVFKVNNLLRTITFAHIDDIINDTGSIEFSNNIVSVPRLSAEDFEGYIMRTTPPKCNYIGSFQKSLDGITIKGEVSLWNNLPSTGNEVNDAFFVRRWRAWFIWNYDPDFGVYNWIFHSIDYSKEVSSFDPEEEDKALKLELPLAAPAAFVYHPEYPNTDPTIGGNSRGWHIPAYHHAGNFEILPEAYRSEPGFALVHYRGLQTDSNAANYPMASNDVNDYNNDKISDANLGLRPDGQYGLYEKRWKNFIQWRLSSPGEYTIEKHLTPLEISNLDWFKWHKILGVDYLFKEIRFSIRNDHITVAEIIAYRR